MPDTSTRRVMVIYGTRPEAIKVAPLIKGLQSDGRFDPVIAVTGQHREMLDQVNDLFSLRADHDLDLMRPGSTLADLSSRALSATTDAIASERPDAVVVQGDTSTAFIAALASFYLQVPVIHLEAGLRTGNLRSPFPEEANRQLIGRLAALHLAPTSTSRQNLIDEGVMASAIATTGNTVIDALMQAVVVPATFSDPAVDDVVTSAQPYVLVTAHRRESWGEPMVDAMQAIRGVAEAHPGARWIVPMHRNPVVREAVEPVLAGLSSVVLTEPLSYHGFCHAMRSAHLLLTDSGGVQEEAPSLGKPVLVMRDNTERPEAVDAGTVRLVGTDRDTVSKSLTLLLDDADAYAGMANAVNPYGDGRATGRCLAAIGDFFGLGQRLPDFDAHAGTRSEIHV